jgi:hypothetical protein
MDLEQLSTDIKAGKYGKIIQFIPVVHFQTEDGKDRVGTLNHAADLMTRFTVAGLLLAAIKALL